MLRTCLLLAACLFSPLASASPCEISLTFTEHRSAPFLEGEGMNPAIQPGIAVEIVTTAVAQAGCSVKLSRTSNLRVLRSVESGDIDGAILFSWDAERGHLMVYPMKGEEPDTARRLATLSYYFYRRKDGKFTWDGSTIKNPDNLPIGINTGFSIADQLKKLGVRLDEVQTADQNLGKLRLGRIGAYAMQEHIADPAIQQLHLEGEIEKLPIPLSTKTYYLTFSRKFYAAHPEIAEKIWAAIAEKRDQMTKTLLQHYHE